MREFVRRIRYFDQLASTNSFALNGLRHRAVTTGDCICCFTQTQGRGQRQKNWHSAAGQNLTFSVVVDLHFLPVARLFSLTQTIALSIADYVRTRITNQHVTIKWANDIYVDDRKIAGILIETQLRMNHSCVAVVGVGVNVNEIFDSNTSFMATSLAQSTGKTYALVDELITLLDSINTHLRALHTQNYTLIHQQYNDNLYKKNQPIQLCYQNQQNTYILRHVLTDGSLVVEDDSARVHTFAFGLTNWVK